MPTESRLGRRDGVVECRWDKLCDGPLGAVAADSGQVVTNSSIAPGAVPVRSVVGGTPLTTGLGDLVGPIPVTLSEFFNMILA